MAAPGGSSPETIASLQREVDLVGLRQPAAGVGRPRGRCGGASVHPGIPVPAAAAASGRLTGPAWINLAFQSRGSPGKREPRRGDGAGMAQRGGIRRGAAGATAPPRRSLSARAITKHFAGVTALDGVDFDLRARRGPRAGRRERRRQVDADEDPRRRATPTTTARSGSTARAVRFAGVRDAEAGRHRDHPPGAEPGPRARASPTTSSSAASRCIAGLLVDRRGACATAARGAAAAARHRARPGRAVGEPARRRAAAGRDRQGAVAATRAS